jgi:hypothetical protein
MTTGDQVDGTVATVDTDAGFDATHEATGTVVLVVVAPPQK